MEEICINRNAIADLLRIKEELDSVVESIELLGNKSFMASYKKSREQVKKREFADWDAL